MIFLFTLNVTSASIGRQTLGRELATIFDYRQRLAQYRTDESLRSAHLSGPWITVWYVPSFSVGMADVDCYQGMCCHLAPLMLVMRSML